MDRKTFINRMLEDFIENVLRETGLFMLMKAMQEQKELDIREFTNLQEENSDEEIRDS
jgi:hypothetical protein